MFQLQLCFLIHIENQFKLVCIRGLLLCLGVLQGGRWETVDGSQYPLTFQVMLFISVIQWISLLRVVPSPCTEGESGRSQGDVSTSPCRVVAVGNLCKNSLTHSLPSSAAWLSKHTLSVICHARSFCLPGDIHGDHHDTSGTGMRREKRVCLLSFRV